MSALFAFLHHVAAFGLVSALVAEMVLLKEDMNAERVRRMAIFDAAYGTCAGILLVVGLLRVAYFEKGAGYYFHNGWFLAKFITFIAVALLSIYPTVQFLKWRKAFKAGNAVVSAAQTRALRRIVHWELTGLIVILLGAALMARGIGFYG